MTRELCQILRETADILDPDSSHNVPSRDALLAVFMAVSAVLGRNSHEAVLADTRNRIVQLFRDGNIEFYIPAPGRRKQRENPEQWIQRVIEPLVDDDMKHDQGSGNPIYRLNVYLPDTGNIELRRFYDSLSYYRRSQSREKTIGARKYTKRSK